MMTDYDVAVVGGGSAGVAAAVASARCGARTLLLERAGCLGGASTSRNVVTYCGLYTLGKSPRQAVAGVAEEVLQGLRRLGAVTGPQRHRGVFVVFEPEAVKRVLDGLCAEAGVDVLLHAFVSGATRQDGRIVDVSWQDHAGAHTVRARAFVDASGEAISPSSGRVDPLHQSTGWSSSARWHALRRHRQGCRRHVRPARPGRRTRRRPVHQEPRARSRACRYRAIWSATSPRPTTIHATPGAFPMPSGTAASRPGPISRRSAQFQDAGPRISVSTGPEFGTRKSRHIDAVHQLTWQDVVAGRAIDDAIALGAWGIEWHDRKTFESTFVYPPDKGTYPIPLRCLVSRDTTNLFAAGRLADADQKAGAALRVMGTALPRARRPASLPRWSPSMASTMPLRCALSCVAKAH